MTVVSFHYIGVHRFPLKDAYKLVGKYDSMVLSSYVKTRSRKAIKSTCIMGHIFIYKSTPRGILEQPGQCKASTA